MKQSSYLLSDLRAAIHQRYPSLKPGEVNRAVDAIFATIVDALGEDDRVELRGFGVFAPRKLAGGERRNPRTGDVVMLPDRRTIGFRTGRDLQRRLNART